MTDMHRALAQAEYDNRERLGSHLPYDREAAFYRSIQAGDAAEAMQLFTPLGQDGFGVLSDDPLRSLQYHLIITVASITRYCITGGMDAETAYNLSDLYIRRIDRCTDAGNIHALHRELVEAYASRMHALVTRPAFSRPVMRCAEYVHAHLHERITMNDMCAVSGLSRAYLSRLFRSEVGMTIMQYVTARKLEAAKNALAHTEQSISAIANNLAFSSESHFISTFRRCCGETPKVYRNHRTAGAWAGSGIERRTT